MKSQLLPFFLTILSIFSTIQLVAQCPDNLLTNGSFNSNEGEAVTAPGWNAISTPDVNDAFGQVNTSNGYTWTGGTPEASEDGGTWQNLYSTEALTQTLILVAGQTYTVEFEYAAMGIVSSGFLFSDPSGIQVLIANNQIYSSPIDNTLFTWEKSCFTFVAPNNVVTLQFQPSVIETYVGIDGVCVLEGDLISNGVDINLGNDTTLCSGQTLTLDVGVPNGNYFWQDGSTNPTYTVTEAGTYYVAVDQYCAFGVDSIIVDYNEATPINLGSDTLLCEGAELLLDASTPNATYIWQDGSTSPTFNVDMTGTYWVEVSDPFCIYSDTIQVSLLNQPTVDLGEDELLICDQNAVNLDVTQSNAFYLWQDGSTQSTLQVDQPGNYAVTVSNACGEANDMIEIMFSETPTVDLGADTSICQGNSLSLNATQDGATYLWQDGSTGADFEINQTGIYAVTLTNECGQISDTIEVDYLTSPIAVNLGEDSILCQGNILSLNAEQDNVFYLWQDGSTDANFEADQTGEYSVLVSNICGEETDTINIEFVQPLIIDFGPDTILCEGTSLSLDVEQDNVTYLWQDGSMQSTYEINQTGLYALTLTNVCGEVSDEIEVDVLLNPSVDLGPDQTFCDQDSFLLSANAQNGNIQWSDGSTEATLVVLESGLYSVTVSNECGEISDDVMLTSGTSPQVDLGPDQVICEGNSLILDAGNSADSYIWQDGSNLSTLEVFREGIYQVMAQNDCGTEIDEIEITIDDCKCDIFIPNAFSPNDDGFNDRLQVFKDCIFEMYQMQIFDRWGNLVFKSDDPDIEWDGRIRGQKASNGVYVYWFTFTNELGISDTRQGSIQLLR